MSVPFRDVLPRVEAALAPFVRADRELTVLRDVSGRVRVVVKGVGKVRVPDADVVTMEAAMRSAVGDWSGEHTPVWNVSPDDNTKKFDTRPSVKLILDELERTPINPTTGLRVVERHLSRDAWTGAAPYDPPCTREEVASAEKPPIITFFSHKGGVGRTTAVVATALLAARDGKKVVMLDLDLEAPGLDALMGEDLVPAEGVLDLLIAPQLDDGALEAASYAPNDPDLIGEATGELRVLTAGKVDDGYLEMLARLDLNASSNREALQGRLRDLLVKVQSKWKPDLILVDARAGFHDLGGLMLATLTHAAVMVLTANPQSLHGLERVARLLGAPGRADSGGSPVPLIIAHGMAPEPGSGESGQRERDRLRVAAHTRLIHDYYPPHLATPDLQAEGVAHAPMPLPWRGPLRGRGGALDAEIAEILREPPYVRLYDRVMSLYPR